MRKNKNARHKLTRHHRLPTSVGGTNDERNISLVPRYLHECYHALFSNHSPATIAAILTEKWIDPDYELICVKKGKHGNH